MNEIHVCKVHGEVSAAFCRAVGCSAAKTAVEERAMNEANIDAFPEMDCITFATIGDRKRCQTLIQNHINEIYRLRDINKDLLEACEAAHKAIKALVAEGHNGSGKELSTLEAAIRKAKPEGK